VRRQWKPFQSQCQWVFFVVLSVSDFHFRFEIWNTFSFWKFVRFQGVFFVARVALAAIFFSRLTSAISLHAQVQFHAKYPPLRQSDRGFTFNYVILLDTPKKSRGKNLIVVPFKAGHCSMMELGA